MTDSNTKQLLEQMSDISSVLANTDAMKIFVQVAPGMKGGGESIQELGMTKKRYYTRLRRLVEAGLIEKIGNKYRYTLLGSLFEPQLANLLRIVKYRKELLMIGELRRSGKFTEAEIGSFVRKVYTNDPRSMDEGCWIIPSIAWTYEEMVETIVRRLSTAKRNIYLASRYTEERIINSMISRAQAGVAVKVLADTRLLNNYVRGAGDRLKSKDDHTSERRKVTVNPFYPYNIERKVCDLPFSFILMDERGVGVELIDARHPDEFSGAVFLENEALFNYLTSVFDSLWKTGVEDASSVIPPARGKAPSP